jgi:hypothetical protein
MKKLNTNESLTKGLTEALSHAKGEIKLKTTILSEQPNKAKFFSKPVFQKKEK